MILEENQIPDQEELIALYDSVRWSSYTDNAESLFAGIANSRYLVTARNDEGKLIGLARIIGDGYTIAYLQDILVHPDYQHCGIGLQLIEAVFAPFHHCRQHVLITDAEPYQRRFYESAGFVEARDWDKDSGQIRCFLRFNNP
ncbi:GNAT family N-acetyltransferase [Trueperella sp. LYQ141]|uniref:GNAT family N-acetyltransferase n=1 Tax=Trueperella sp. LYQ141 TaxID=3391058 RepID=UPI003983CA49